MTRKKKTLGRGLDALLGASAAPKPGPDAAATSDSQLKELPVEWIQPGKYQPRTGMDPDRLQELAESIKAQGVVQPVVVRPIGKDRYELIAGERRWRAAQLAKLDRIPTVIRDVADQATMAMALIENIQREDLNPVEEANALKRLIDEFALTHQQTAEAVGRSRASVSNLLRLLDLESVTLKALEGGQLEMGHARALLGLKGELQQRATHEVIGKKLTVRQTEALVREMASGGKAAKKKASKAADPDIQRLEQELTERIGARVSINHQSSGKGKLEIRYHSADELDGILQRIQ